MHKTESELKELEFSRIPPVAECWQQVLSYGRRLKFLKGVQICHAGTDSASLFFLVSGEIRLTRSSLDGREKIIWSIGPGSLFGETPFFDELPARSAMVAAKDCTVYAFARQCVLSEILPRHPDLMLALFRSLALKVRVLSNQTVCLSHDDLPSRICKYLHLRQQGEPAGTGALAVSPGLNQQELANLLGVHRVTLNKSLRELEKAGILGPYSRDEVYILNRPQFEKIVFQNE
jgi:CRP-like cAMP-binding protein